MRFLSQTPILPLDGASPIELTRSCVRASTGAVIGRVARVAPVFDCSGALGRVKTALAALGAPRS